jgi:predicted RNA-binding Zn-ribbon protein involved in translation (DUF1610 family)
MNNSNKIIPWICPVCQKEFNIARSGTCRRCGHLVCARHLRHAVNMDDVIDKNGQQLVCPNCLKKGEKTESILRWNWRRAWKILRS